MTDAPDLTPPIMERYYQLRTFLGIDTLDLDRAYQETPRILQDAGELSADADANEAAMRHTYDVIKAEASHRIRTVMVAGKEPSEARIDKLLPLEQDVQDARVALDTAHRMAQVCNSLYRSMESQARMLPKASDMVMGGYITPSAAYDQRRKDIRQAHIAAATESRREEGRPIGRPTV